MHSGLPSWRLVGDPNPNPSPNPNPYTNPKRNPKRNPNQVTLHALLHDSMGLVPVCSPDGRRGGFAPDLGGVGVAAAAGHAERELGRNLGSSCARAAAAAVDSRARADSGDEGLFQEELALALRRAGEPVLAVRHVDAGGPGRQAAYSLMAAAVLSDEGEPLGVVEAVAVHGAGFTQDDAALLALLLPSVRPALLARREQLSGSASRAAAAAPPTNSPALPARPAARGAAHLPSPLDAGAEARHEVAPLLRQLGATGAHLTQAGRCTALTRPHHVAAPMAVPTAPTLCRCTIFVLDQGRQRLTYHASAEGGQGGEEAGHVPARQGLAGYVSLTGERVNLRDAYTDSRFDPSPDTLSGRRTKARSRRLATLPPDAIQAAALCEPFCSRTRDQAATLPGPACNPARSHLQPKRPSLQPPQALLCAPICDPSGGEALGAVQLVTEAG